MSKTKGGGSTRNGRDSNAQRLGVKVFGGTSVQAAPSSSASGAPSSIPGINVGLGGDDTLFALADGTVQFGQPQGPQAGRRGHRRLSSGLHRAASTSKPPAGDARGDAAAGVSAGPPAVTPPADFPSKDVSTSATWVATGSLTAVGCGGVACSGPTGSTG